MKAKKIFALLLALACVFSFAACSGGNAGSDSSDGEVSVFYYTFSDTYISSVRSAMDKLLSDSGVKYNNYDANGNQTTQTEQVTTAIAKGSKLLIVNVVDTRFERRRSKHCRYGKGSEHSGHLLQPFG